MKGIEENSPIYPKTQIFVYNVIKLVKCDNIFIHELDTSKQVMHDLTHLNCYGAKRVSEFIGEKIKKHERTTFCIRNGRESAKNQGL